MSRPIVIIAEHFEGKVRPITLEMVSCLREIQKSCPSPGWVIILGEEIQALTQETAGKTGMETLGISVRGLTSYHGETYRKILSGVLSEMDPAYVLLGHTSQGWDLAPALAVEIRAACITAVEGIIREDGRLSFMRGVYNGKLTAVRRALAQSCVLTVQPGSFSTRALSPAQEGQYQIRRLPHPLLSSCPGDIRLPEGMASALSEAEVIVAAGQGIGKQERLTLIRELAGLFPRSAVAGSRSVCDRGWLEYRCQVGLTGATVSPKLYIACGISGASQHVAGIKGAGFIAAINTDPQAAILSHSDVYIVEDLVTFIPVLIKQAIGERP